MLVLVFHHRLGQNIFLTLFMNLRPTMNELREIKRLLERRNFLHIIEKYPAPCLYMCHFQFRLMSENVSFSRINLHFLTKFETKSNFCQDFDNFRETLFMSHFFQSFFL